jgi:hypothetical protein
MEHLRRIVRYASLLLAAALALGCESLLFSLNPFASTEAVVAASGEHGPYLFADLTSSVLREAFITPLSAPCAGVLAPEAQVHFQRRGNFGRLSRDEETCEAVGTLSLGARRAQRRVRDSVVPRSTARFTLAHRDAQYILLRGRFALASRVGIPSGFDLVAVLPVSPVCDEVAARSEATLEFRPAGDEPFRLLASGQHCVVAGFAMPVEGLPAGPPPSSEGEEEPL